MAAESYSNKMSWQDIILAVGSGFFSVALLPSVFGHNKPEWSSSLMTGTWLVAFAIVYATLDLWFAFGTTVVTAFIWYVLLVQVATRRGK